MARCQLLAFHSRYLTSIVTDKKRDIGRKSLLSRRSRPPVLCWGCPSVCPFVCLIIIIIRQLIRRRNMSIKSLLHRASGTTCLPTSFLHRHWLFSSGAWRLICLDNHSADNWFCYLSLKLCLRQDNYCRLILILILIIIIQGPKCVHKKRDFLKN